MSNKICVNLGKYNREAVRSIRYAPYIHGIMNLHVKNEACEGGFCTVTKRTPMMEQYTQLKTQVPNAFLFFRLGDFYEMFFDDAVVAARELDITLTGRDAGSQGRIPMCGVPYHAAEGYITKLIQRGYHVAICEQTNTPEEAKGLVQRAIVRIVTPGTHFSSDAQTASTARLLVALCGDASSFGLAALDVTTGELWAMTCSSVERLGDELYALAAAEIVCNEATRQILTSFTWLTARNICITTRADVHVAKERVCHVFPQVDPSLLHEKETYDAVMAVLYYVYDTQKKGMEHIRLVERADIAQQVEIDASTRHNLELIESVRQHGRHGSLLGVLDATVTAMGGRRLRRWVDKPLTHLPLLLRRHDAVDVMYQQPLERAMLIEQLKAGYDIQRLIGRIATQTAAPRDFVMLARTLVTVPAIKQLLDTPKFLASRIVASFVHDVDPCVDVYERCVQALHADLWMNLRSDMVIQTGYDAKLDALRQVTQEGKQWIATLEQEEREATGIRSLKVGYTKVFGYYIEVTHTHNHAIPQDRYECKQTLSGAQRYVTAALKEKEARILEATEQLESVEQALFHTFSNTFAPDIVRLQALADALATLDALQSLATVATTQRYVRPHMHDGYDVQIKEGRHPVIETMCTTDEFVANDTTLSADGTRMLLITGPNMAGKSTYMRQVALLHLMAQMGSFVPARKAILPIVDKVFTRIGASDDLVGGQSTFMVEMRDIQQMITRATSRSLVIIDELGRGTASNEGQAIAQAVMEHIHHTIRCKTLISTHYRELAHVVHTLPHMDNATMAVHEQEGRVLFLKKLVAGIAESSYGIYCAERAGLPSALITRAYTLLQGEVAHERAYAQKEAVSTPPPSYEQLYLQTQANTSSQQWIVQEFLHQLQQWDVLRMTPLAALQHLHDLKQRLQERSLDASSVTSFPTEVH